MILASQWDGKCKGTVNESGEIVIHTWKVGESIHYQANPKCVCVNEQCFEKQKNAVSDPAQNKQQITAQNRTESEKTDDAKHMLEILWTMAHTKALEVFPLHGSNASVEGQEEFWHSKDRVILAEVFFKQLSYNWSRP